MSHLARRSLLLAMGACLVAAPEMALAGGWHGGFHHHGYSYQSTTTTNGVFPATTMVGVAPAATYTGVMAAPMAIPTMMATPMTYSALTAMPMAFPTVAAGSLSFPTLTAASAYPSMGLSLPPAASAAPPATPEIVAAQQHAFAAPASQASLASMSYPYLAQAAQRRNLDGGRFVLFLREALRRRAGPNGAGAISFLRPFLVEIIRSFLGQDPGTSGLEGEIERLLGELNVGESGTSGEGRCFTIRICIDGGTPRVVGGGVAQPASQDGSTPGLSLPPASPSSQQAPASGQAQSGDPGDKAPPAPPTPAAALPPDGDAARRHDQVMGAFADMSTTLKEIRDSLDKLAPKPATAAQ